jgi:phospholipase/carboxylesterase
MHALIDQGTAGGPVILLLHGRGSDENDIFPVGRLLHDTATIVAVQAPFPAAPWGYGRGYAWYRFIGGTTPEPESFVAGQEALRQVIEELPATIGRAPTQLLLGGFSQGGTSSLAFALRNPGLVDGVMVFSGFLAAHPSVAATPATVGATLIFWGHGDADGSIPLGDAKSGQAALRAAGASLESHTYPGMGHTITPAEVRDARAWVATILNR